MIPLFRTKLRKIATALCVLLALVFVQMGSASAVNDLQHHLNAQDHDHIIVALTSIDEEHRHDHQDQGESPVETSDIDTKGELDFNEHANHHHHSDAPTGFTAGSPGIDALRPAAARVLIGRSDTPPKGLQPLGPERPPKPAMTVA